MKNKAVWWTTGICAVIGVSQGLPGIVSLGTLGFLASFTVVFLHRANRKSKQQNGKSLLAKMADDHAQAVKRRESNLRAKLKERMKCPRCGSQNIQMVGTHKQGFSVGKAVGGAILTGGVGSLAGFTGKQTGKSDWVCLDCGKPFTIK